jgi:hypothetical protein
MKSNSTYSGTYSQQQAAIEETERASKESARQGTCLGNFMRAHPELSQIEANVSVIRDYFGKNSQEEIDSDSLEAALRHEKLRERLSFTNEQQERGQLCEFILKNRQMQQRTAQAERERFMSPHTDIETLRQIKENIVSKRALSAKTVPELREIVRGPQGQQWKPVPQIYRNRSCSYH